MKIVFALAIALTANVATADIETDKDAGACAGYLAATGRGGGVEAAIAMSDNSKRAIQFAKNYMRELGDTSPNSRQSIANQGAVACGRVGIKPRDYGSK